MVKQLVAQVRHDHFRPSLPRQSRANALFGRANAEHTHLHINSVGQRGGLPSPAVSLTTPVLLFAVSHGYVCDGSLEVTSYSNDNCINSLETDIYDNFNDQGTNGALCGNEFPGSTGVICEYGQPSFAFYEDMNCLSTSNRYTSDEPLGGDSCMTEVCSTPTQTTLPAEALCNV